ncbi:MAG: glycosyltransferase [Pseudomonadota bacterium]
MIFSVIVPFFNEQLYIERCIRSLLDQDFDHDEYELLFIDNGSDDGSAEIVQKFPQVTLLHESKKNPYTARNKALETAKGKIIAFTDADCVAPGNWLSVINRAMQEVNATIVLGKVLFPATPDSPLEILQDYQNAKIDYLLTHRKNRYLYGYTNNMAVSAKVFDQLGPFLEWPVPGDTEIVHRCLKGIPDARVVFLKEMTVLHLEIGSIFTWMKKSYVYGKHNTLISIYADYKPYDFSTARAIRNFCSKNNRYTGKKRVALLWLQNLMAIAYVTGAIIGYTEFFLLRRHTK